MMNKEIKFRAWHKINKCMLDVLEISFDWDEIVTKRSEDKPRENSCGCCDDRIDDWFYLHDCELIQFTGLHDKNNKEIYDGDILQDERGVKYRIYNIIGGFAHSLPQFNSTYTGIDPYPLQPLADAQTVSWMESNCEVIGNIYENSELLKS